MKCVVTGGSGFIGTHLVRKLMANNWDVYVLDVREPLVNVNWIQADIREALGNTLNGFEFVFHLAALSNARLCGEQPVHCYEINVRGTINVLNACRSANVHRLVMASSAWLGGAQVGEVVNEESPFDITNVNTIYGASKLSQETLCISFHSEFQQPSYTILRYGTPYGEYMWPGLVVRSFMQMAERYKRITIMGDGKQFREFLYVGDLCDAHLKLLDDVSRNNIYNLTGNKPITVEALAHEITKHFPAEIEYIPQARIEPKLKKVENERSKQQLGWNPDTPLAEGIKKCVEWWRSLSEEDKSAPYWANNLK
jgi:UDP-glucose 4-epimerase